MWNRLDEFNRTRLTPSAGDFDAEHEIQQEVAIRRIESRFVEEQRQLVAGAGKLL